MTIPLPTRSRRVSGALAALVTAAWFVATPGSAQALAGASVLQGSVPSTASAAETAPGPESAPVTPGSATSSLEPGEKLPKPGEWCYTPPCPPGKMCAAYVICRPCPPPPIKFCRPMPCLVAPCPVRCYWPLFLRIKPCLTQNPPVIAPAPPLLQEPTTPLPKP